MNEYKVFGIVLLSLVPFAIGLLIAGPLGGNSFFSHLILMIVMALLIMIGKDMFEYGCKQDYKKKKRISP